jgi:hypothetical protein
MIQSGEPVQIGPLKGKNDPNIEKSTHSYSLVCRIFNRVYANGSSRLPLRLLCNLSTSCLAAISDYWSLSVRLRKLPCCCIVKLSRHKFQYDR